MAPNAGALAPNAGLLAAPKAGLLLGAPNGELEAPKAVVAPKAPPAAGDAAPVLPLQPSCEWGGMGCMMSAVARCALARLQPVRSCWTAGKPSVLNQVVLSTKPTE